MLADIEVETKIQLTYEDGEEKILVTYHYRELDDDVTTTQPAFLHSRTQDQHHADERSGDNTTINSIKSIPRSSFEKSLPYQPSLQSNIVRHEQSCAANAIFLANNLNKGPNEEGIVTNRKDTNMERERAMARTGESHLDYNILPPNSIVSHEMKQIKMTPDHLQIKLSPSGIDNKPTERLSDISSSSPMDLTQCNDSTRYTIQGNHPVDVTFIHSMIFPRLLLIISTQMSGIQTQLQIEISSSPIF